MLYFILSVNYDMEKKGINKASAGVKWLCHKVSKSFGKKLLYKRVPILDWLPKYQRDHIMSDLVAGITVGLTVIPQAIAYANVAGLPPQVKIKIFVIIFVN